MSHHSRLYSQGGSLGSEDTPQKKKVLLNLLKVHYEIY